MKKYALVGIPLAAVMALGATALAQVDTASTTEPTAEATTSTEVLVETTPAAPETPVSEATTTSATQVGAEATTLASTTPEVSAPSEAEVVVSPAPTPIPEPTPLATASGVIIAQEVAALEAAYFEKHGKFLQVLPNNQLPEHENGTVADKLGVALRSSARVDVYESPQGAGYQITFQDGNTLYSFGYGPEWVERTYSRVILQTQASSTPATVQ